ncbi:MAG: hypothetical protein K2X74_08575, partial [Acetobacteraceae bacterium]|nr:hypothetical protein [Acetobacteraceae bacterium]
VGDVLTFALGSGDRAGRGVRVWRVLALAARRGPAPQARLLYEDLSGDDRPDAPATEAAPDAGPAR